MTRNFKSWTTVSAAAIGLLAFSGPAHATLALTAAGTSLGFTLTTFLSGFDAQYGPLAQGVLPNGNIITGSLLNNKIYVFSDVDNQTLTNALSATSYTCQTGNCNFAMATAGGQVYGAQAQGGTYLHFNEDGSSTPIPNLVADGLTSNLGMWGDPVNGDLISSSSRGLVDINPVTGTFRVINGSANADGVTVSPDGSIVYAEVGGTIQAYNFVTGALLHTYNVGHSPDGTGVISGGALNGDIVVNNNDGTVGLLNPNLADTDPNQYTLIATGGTRGDFVSPDLNNGTLFLSQNERVDRLSCGPGCSIGSTGTPEPATLALFGAGVLGLVGLRRRISSR